MNRAVLAAVAALAAHAPLRAAELIPVARVTIYPGDAIADSVLEDRPYPLARDSEALYIRSREALIGKVARRTLLPGQPIPAIAIDNPRIVTAGAQIKIVYSDGALEIVSYGIAQQSGALGDLIRIRNQDSGLTVFGRVQSDGSARVGEG